MNPNDGSPASPSKSFLRSSPRSSMDSHATSSSPFLQNLHQRLRKGSNASSSNSSDPSLSQEGPSRPENTQSARRFLLSVTRDDWEYPPITTSVNPSLPVREPVEFRSRQEGQSDQDSDNNAARRKSKNDPYKFESPDAVAAIVMDRRRKRRRLVDEEMEWNNGLRMWAQRRDAWTAATKDRPPKPGATGMQTRREHHESATSDSTDGSMNCPSSPQSAVLDVSSSMESVQSVDPLDGPWLPIFPPLLAESSDVRSKIKPSAYPLIYSKVVIQNLTPNVPIPLTHMTSTLVEGWKSEGNWPPQPSTVIAQDLKTGKKSSTFLRWRKEQDDTGGTKGRVRRSIGAMKKALTIGTNVDPLEELDIEFQEQNDIEMEGNVTLNKGLLVENG